jgi:endonuclease YncB( thermonuclease family)
MGLELSSLAPRPRGRAHTGRVGAALAAVTFAAGLALGLVIAPDIGRQVRANPAPVPAPTPAPAVAAASESARTARGAHAAEVLRVLDGDTFEARVRVWPGIEITTKVRLRGIDAPELRSAKCADEHAMAETARDALRQLLADGDVMVMRVDLDKYGGRVLASAATRTTPDISAAMLAKGLARPYAGGRREGWCPGAVGSGQ